MCSEQPELNVPSGHCSGPDMAIRALVTGEKKARLAFLPTLVLGILAGVYIGFGGNVFTIAKDTPGLPFGVQQLLCGLMFSLGLILVVIGGAELFTGNTLISMAWLSGRVTTRQLLRNWAIVYLGNLIGSLILVWLVYGAAQYLMDDKHLGEMAVKIAATKCSLPFMVVLYRGILCNALVCLAVWLCYSCSSTTDKILAIIFPITAFIAGGFEHCVANMYLIPMGMAIKAAGLGAADPNIAKLTMSGFIGNLIPSTIGNIIGGAIMVGGVYWVAYVLPHKDLPTGRLGASPRRRHRDAAAAHRPHANTDDAEQ